MPRVTFTAHLAAIGPPDDTPVPGATVKAALDAVFADYPRLEGYILDDQSRPRHHIVIFVDGARCSNDNVLQMAVAPSSEIFVLQALSGGRGESS